MNGGSVLRYDSWRNCNDRWSDALESISWLPAAEWTAGARSRVGSSAGLVRPITHALASVHQTPSTSADHITSPPPYTTTTALRAQPLATSRAAQKGRPFLADNSRSTFYTWTYTREYKCNQKLISRQWTGKMNVVKFHKNAANSIAEIIVFYCLFFVHDS